MTFTDCTFVNNSAFKGGCFYPFMSDNLNLERCTFVGNSAGLGAALDLDSCVNTTVVGCTFTNNTSAQYGGAVTLTGPMRSRRTRYQLTRAGCQRGLAAAHSCAP
jgi:Chlamydia polymorphic membrane protein (Chlamydia_PMP) repeat